MHLSLPVKQHHLFMVKHSLTASVGTRDLQGKIYARNVCFCEGVEPQVLWIIPPGPHSFRVPALLQGPSGLDSFLNLYRFSCL